MTRTHDLSGCPLPTNDPAVAAVENRRQLDALRRGVRNDPPTSTTTDLEEFLR